MHAGGVGRQLGAEHSQRLESYFQSIPGVQLVAVSTVRNAKALLKAVSGRITMAPLACLPGSMLPRAWQCCRAGFVFAALLPIGATEGDGVLLLCGVEARMTQRTSHVPLQAIRSDNPIIFFEHVLLYNVKGEVGGAAG